jgi:hypothetical protein
MVSQRNVMAFKRYPASVRIRREQLPTIVSLDKRSAPAVLIGDAGGSIPWNMTDDHINNAIVDGMHPGRLIVERFYTENDDLFRLIPHNSYQQDNNGPVRRCREARNRWVRQWLKDHGEEAETFPNRWVLMTKHFRRPVPPKPEFFESQFYHETVEDAAAANAFLNFAKGRTEARIARSQIDQLANQLDRQRRAQVYGLNTPKLEECDKAIEEVDPGRLVVKYAERTPLNAAVHLEGEVVTILNSPEVPDQDEEKERRAEEKRQRRAEKKREREERRALLAENTKEPALPEPL